MDYDVEEKLADAEAHIDGMRAASDFVQFRREFNACLAALRSVGWKLEAQTKRKLKKSGRRKDLPIFQVWWSTKRAIADLDPLLDWARTARDADTHAGQGGAFSTSFALDSVDMADAVPPPRASSTGIQVLSSGLFWIIDKGTAGERRRPVKFRAGTRSAAAQNIVTVVVSNPPAEHLGQPLPRNDAITLCELTADYWRMLADETFTEWWGTA